MKRFLHELHREGIDENSAIKSDADPTVSSSSERLWTEKFQMLEICLSDPPRCCLLWRYISLCVMRRIHRRQGSAPSGEITGSYIQRIERRKVRWAELTISCLFFDKVGVEERSRQSSGFANEFRYRCGTFRLRTQNLVA